MQKHKRRVSRHDLGPAHCKLTFYQHQFPWQSEDCIIRGKILTSSPLNARYISQRWVSKQQAMNHMWSESFARMASFPLKEDIIVQRIFHTHDPDGRLLDSELCLRAVEAVMSHASASEVSRQQPDCTEICKIEVDGSEEPLGYTICNLSHEILRLRNGKEDMCTRPLILFDLLSKYRWDAKFVLMLSAFAMIYGEFGLIMSSQNNHSLASSIAIMRELPRSWEKLKLILEAIYLLVSSTAELTRIVILFERLPLIDAEINEDLITTTKSLIYVAAYWISRSILVCASKLGHIRATEDVEVSEFWVSDVVWQVSGLEHRMRSISEELKLQVNACKWEVGLKMHKKLLNLFNETHSDNQKVLRMLFSWKDNMPLKHPSQAKHGISELANKVVLLLISKPELLPIDELLLLIQQIHDHPLRGKSSPSYEIAWVPIASSENWSDNEIKIYNFLSSSLPWYSVRKPWSLSPTTINHIRQEWKFQDEPIIIALDPVGHVSNLNAIDMAWIWGAEAFPFSTLREEDLWRKESWNLKLLAESVSPLLSMWIERGQTICIYGSNSLEWIQEFTAKMKKTQGSVPQLEVVYVGKKSPDEDTRNIISFINKGEFGSHITWNNVKLFWVRLESMRRSKLRLKKLPDSDHILNQVEELIEASGHDNGSGWMIIGTGSSTNIVKLNGEEVIKAFSLFPLWQNDISGLGLVDAIKMSLEIPPKEPCYHSRTIKYDETAEDSLICQNCRRQVKKFIVFDAV